MLPTTEMTGVYSELIHTETKQTIPKLDSVLQKIVSKVNESALETIYTYTGDDKHTPVYYEETFLFKKMIAETGITCKVVEVSDKMFHPKEWDPQSSLLHIPGAMSSALDEHLGNKIPDIKVYVQNGGRIWGWCGGGYWLCRKVKYRVSESETMLKIRDLAFWKGTQQGPLLPFLGNPEGNIGFFHGAVKVKWLGSEELKKLIPDGLVLNVLLSGGGSFIPAEEEHPYKVLASYSEHSLLKSVAAVKTFVGKGISVIVNPYFTHGASYFLPALEGYKKHLPGHPWERIVEDLTGNDVERKICFADMLLELA